MSTLYWSLREAIETTPDLFKCQICFWSLREAIETKPALYWSLREAASWLKNLWHWPELGTVPPPDVHFCRVGSGNKENIEESWVILVTSHIVLTWTWCITTWVQPSVLGSVSAFVWLLELTWCLLLQETKPTMLTKFDEKGYLRETYFSKECLSLICRIKEFKIMVAGFLSAISSSSTHFRVSEWCQWKRCATNIIAYSFEYNNKNTFLSPYNALALKNYLSSTILDAYC